MSNLIAHNSKEIEEKFLTAKLFSHANQVEIKALLTMTLHLSLHPPPKKNIYIYIYIYISHSLYLHGGHPQISTSLMRIHSEIRLQNIAYIITISNIFSLYLPLRYFDWPTDYC